MISEECHISDSGSDYWAVDDMDDERVLEIPKWIAADAAAARRVLDWVAPLVAETHRTGVSQGRIEGAREVQRAFRKLMGLADAADCESLRNKVGVLEDRI